MRKILAFCLFCNFVFGSAAAYHGTWKSVKIKGVEISCSGKKEVFGSEGANIHNVFGDTVAYCIEKNNKISWIARTSFSSNLDTDQGVSEYTFEKNCNKNFECKDKENLTEDDIKIEIVEESLVYE